MSKNSTDDVTQVTPADVKKMLKPELIAFALQMLSEYNLMAVALDNEIMEDRMTDAMVMDRDRTIDAFKKRIRELTADLRTETRRREEAFDDNRHLLVTKESLLRQLREEKKAHQKTRERVKTAPRFRIDSDALLDMSKTGAGADSNLSEMFGDCDITITAPEPKKETRQPNDEARSALGKMMAQKIASAISDRDKGMESFLSLLRRGPGLSRGSGEENPLGDMITQTILSELAKGDEALCPICGVKDCPGTELMRGHAVAMDCEFGGPSHMCEHCREHDCRFKGLSEETIETMANDVDTFNIDGPFSLRDLIILQSGGKAMAMPFTDGRRRGPGL